MEETEVASQKARVVATKARIEADEKIAVSEHELELKRIALKKTEEARSAEVAKTRVQDELKRREMQFEYDKKEVRLLKDNPELMILSPQITRLAEATQSMRNARTIVSLSPNELNQGAQLLGMLQAFLQNILSKSQPSGSSKKK